MNELVPLLDTSENSRTRALLEAGRADVPPGDFSERLLVGLGVSAAVSSAASVAAASGTGAAIHGAASTGSGAATLALVTAKWVVVGVLGGGILASGTELAFSTRSAPPVVRVTTKGSTQPRTDAAPRAGAAVTPSAFEAAPPEVPAVTSTASTEPRPTEPRPLAHPQSALPAAAAAAASAQQGQLGREVQAIDFARRALATGDYARALSELDAFERMPQTGVLEREAQVLRIETLYKLGQVSRAKTLSDQYLRAFPNDAHAARLHALGPGEGAH